MQHYANEFTYVEKVSREMKVEEQTNAERSQTSSGPHQHRSDPEEPKIEGPVLIEFHAESEKDDEDYTI